MQKKQPDQEPLYNKRDHRSKSAKEAAFSEVNEEDERREADQEAARKANLPAPKYKLTRHPLLKGADIEPELIQELEKELTIDEELCLDHQAKETCKKAFKSDIDGLTSENDYIRVTSKTIEKLFQIPRLNLKCVPINIKSFVLAFISTLWIGTISIIISFVLTNYLVTHRILIQPWPVGVFGVSFAVIGVIAFVIDYALVFLNTEAKDLEWEVIKVKLKTEGLKQTKMVIPLFAKEKTLIAKRTGIFEDFVIATPEIIITNMRSSKIPFPDLDSCILGVTRDERLFMICYWDIFKDIEKTEESIEMLQRFKIEA